MHSPTISFLLSVYYKDDPQVLEDCLESILHQTQTADETIIIVEGELSTELKKVLEDYKKKILNCNIMTLHSVPGPMKFGLPACLNYGIHLSSSDYILRIDSDDINDLERVEIVKKFIAKKPNILLGGSNIIEFDENMIVAGKSRIVPENNDDILKFSKYRNPFNGPSVFFHRETAIMLGGYPLIASNEDYCFWVKFLKNKLPTYNIQKNLVKMRAGKAIIKRRSSKRYIIGEWQSIRFMYGIGHFSFTFYILQIISRTFIRLFPLKMIQLIYNSLLRN